MTQGQKSVNGFLVQPEEVEMMNEQFKKGVGKDLPYDEVDL